MSLRGLDYSFMAFHPNYLFCNLLIFCITNKIWIMNFIIKDTDMYNKILLAH